MYLTIGTAAGTSSNLVVLSDMTISPNTPEKEATNRLNVLLGGASNYLYFYDNVWDGAFVDLNGGKGTNTLDEYRGGNEGSNLTVVNFADRRSRRNRLRLVRRRALPHGMHVCSPEG